MTCSLALEQQTKQDFELRIKEHADGIQTAISVIKDVQVKLDVAEHQLHQLRNQSILLEIHRINRIHKRGFNRDFLCACF